MEEKLPRYCVGLQKADDPCCYKDFHECNSLSEAKSVAESKSSATGKSVIVFDRKENEITYRIDKEFVLKKIEKVEKPEKVKPEKKVKRK